MELQTDIYRTLAYFSYFGYPLTAFEVWKYLYRPSQMWSFGDVVAALDVVTGQPHGVAPTTIQTHDGHYGFHDEKHGSVRRQVGVRHDRYLDAIRKYRRLKWLVRYLKCLPFVRGVAVCNTLAFHHTKPESDIDLFIITSPGRIWTTRFLAVAPLIALRLRPREAKRDPIDVSFLVSEQALNFDALRLQPDDPYFTYWLATLRPVIDRGGVFDRLARDNSTSLADLPNSKMLHSKYDRLFSEASSPRAHRSEKWFEKLQRAKFPVEILDLQNHDSRVVVTSDVLKFHKNDRRAEIRDYLETKMKLCATS